MNDAEVDAMSQNYNRALDAQRKEIDSYRQSDAILREENVKLRAEVERLLGVIFNVPGHEIIHRGRGYESVSALVLALEDDLKAANLQYREAAKMASILLDYIHALKRHEASIQLCKKEPCPATLEFLSKSEKRKCPRGHAMLNDGGPCYICGAGDADHP